MDTGTPVIEVRGLRKSYGEHEVVRGIDLEVHRGEVFAFLGPNGAGKTTTVEIMEGYRSRDAGTVSVLGEDPASAGRRWRSRVGLVLQSCTMPAELTVAELVELYGGYYPRPRPAAQTIELVGLSGQRHARTRQLSGGQLRRLDVAQSRYFTLLLPIVFLVIFAAIFKGTTIVDGRPVKLTTFYVPAIMTLGIISASFVNLTQAVVAQRESGELKRLRGTPLPTSLVIASRAAVGVVVAVLMSALLLLLGRLAYGVPIPGSPMLGLLIAVVLGAGSFACIAFALSARIGTAEAAPPTTNLTVLPLYFISGVFVPESQIPRFLRDIATVFPIHHLARALLQPITHTHGTGISGADPLVIAAWGLAALLIAARTFQFSPRTA